MSLTYSINHDGMPLSALTDLFAPIPPQIGPLISAHSTLEKGNEEGPGKRVVLFWWIGFPCLAFIITFLIVYNHPQAGRFPLEPAFGIGVLAALAALFLGGWVYFSFLRYYHCCTYVGSDGVARFYCKGRRNNIVSEEIFLFDQAEELFVNVGEYYKFGQLI